VTRPRVVLAEDNAAMAGQLTALLRSECDVVAIVQDGQALIDAVEAWHPDVIVSDVAMPGLGRLAAARVIVARHPAARIVFVTVRNEGAVIRKALSEGARGYVVKGDAGDALPGAVRTVLADGRYVSSSARAALEASGPSGSAREHREPGD
jgi:DNA-binding NarL/FixJ family response regulator